MPDSLGLAARQVPGLGLVSERVPVEAPLLAAEPLRPEPPFFRRPDEVSLPGLAEPARAPERFRPVPARAPLSLQAQPSFQSTLPANMPRPAARPAPAE